MRPACTFGTTPVTISATTRASTASAWGVRPGAGRVRSSSAGRSSSDQLRRAGAATPRSPSSGRPAAACRRPAAARPGGPWRMAIRPRRRPSTVSRWRVRGRGPRARSWPTRGESARHDGLGHADVLRLVGEERGRERQGLEGETLLERARRRRRGAGGPRGGRRPFPAAAGRTGRRSCSRLRGRARRRGRWRPTCRAGHSSSRVAPDERRAVPDPKPVARGRRGRSSSIQSRRLGRATAEASGRRRPRGASACEQHVAGWRATGPAARSG